MFIFKCFRKRKIIHINPHQLETKTVFDDQFIPLHPIPIETIDLQNDCKKTLMETIDLQNDDKNPLIETTNIQNDNKINEYDKNPVIGLDDLFIDDIKYKIVIDNILLQNSLLFDRQVEYMIDIDKKYKPFIQIERLHHTENVYKHEYPEDNVYFRCIFTEHGEKMKNRIYTTFSNNLHIINNYKSFVTTIYIIYAYLKEVKNYYDYSIVISNHDNPRYIYFD